MLRDRRPLHPLEGGDLQYWIPRGCRHLRSGCWLARNDKCDVCASGPTHCGRCDRRIKLQGFGAEITLNSSPLTFFGERFAFGGQYS